MVKKRIMTQIWRIQQSQALIGIVLWSLALAGIFKDVFLPVFVDWGLVRSDQVALGIFLLFVMVLTGIIAIGFVYDRLLQLWKEQTYVAIQRNPYARERLNPKEILLWKKAYLRILGEVARTDKSAQKDLEFMQRWIDSSLESDPLLKKDVEDIEQSIMARGSRKNH